MSRARPSTPANAVRRRSRSVLVASIVPALVLVLWQVLSTRSALIPSVPDTLRELVHGVLDGRISAPLLDSLRAVFVGFVIAAMIGMFAGVVLGGSRRLGTFFAPFLNAAFSVPKIVVYPIILAVFNVGHESKIALAVLAAVFPITLSVMAAIRDVNPTLPKVGRSLRCSRWQLAWLFYLPPAVPAITVGVRIGLSTAFISVIIAELFAASAGIGLEMQTAYSLREFGEMYACVTLIVLVAVLGNLALRGVELRARRQFE